MNDAVKAWPTPRTTDTNGPGHHGTGGMDLRTMAVEHGPQAPSETGPEYPSAYGRRQLNPLFVEWLMGIPVGWTDCAPLEMESFRWWWHTHSRLLREALEQ